MLATMSAITNCLALPDGCKVVPGVSEDALTASLALSIAGGIVAGSVTRIEPQGFVTARWQWLLVFSPLWGSLFINFGACTMKGPQGEQCLAVTLPAADTH